MASSADRRQFEQISSLFEALCDLPPSEQEQALAQKAPPQAVADEVRSLLGLDRAAPTAMEASRLNLRASALETDGPSEETPAAIGGYPIIRVLGRGGMGVVYEAEQHQPRRRVALKVLNSVVVSPELLRRFEHEAQVLGRLQHPGIARIIEAGTFDNGSGSQPFFAMEYVEGSPLDAYASDRDLDLGARLDLFAAICDAVHHAHQRGVVHRDLKPANILVEEDGTPKVLDFGVARLTESDRPETLLTAVGQIVGTLGFMSPEQASGDPDLDTSSDVYTLGVVLYALLSGSMPHETRGLGMSEAIRCVIDRDPARLGTIQSHLRGDVETIVHKALEKDRTRRYESAAAFAADIRRYRNNEPIAARPPTAMYQLRKFARRNRPLVAGLVLTAVTLVAATAVAITLTIEKERERADADAVASFLSDLFADAKPKDRGVGEVSALELLDAGYAKLNDYTGGRPLRRAMLLEALGKTYRNLSADDRAEELLRGALAIRRDLQGDDHPDTMEAMNSLGILCRKTGQLEEAVALYQAALAGQRRLYGSRDERVAQTMNNLSVALRSMKRDEEALALIEEASRITLELNGPEDTGAITQRVNYGLNLATLKREEAIAVLREIRELSHATHGPNHTATLHAGYALGTACLLLEEFTEAATVLKPVLEGQRKVFGEEASETASTWYSLGEAYRRSNRDEEGLRCLREAHRLGVALLGAGHSWVVSAQFKQALALFSLGRLDEAREVAAECLETALESLGPDHAKVADARDLLKDIEAMEPGDREM